MIEEKYSKNEELVLKFQNGDDYAFTELFELNEGLIRELVNNYNYIKVVDEEVMISACHEGFMNAARTYKEDGGTKFSSYCMGIMNNEIIREIAYMNQKDRKKLIQTQVYINRMVQNKDGETEAILLLDAQELETYFEGRFLGTEDAIDYAMSKSKAEYKNHIVSILCGDYTMVEIGEIYGASKQSVKYQVEKFKSFMREYMEYNNIKTLQQAFN